MKKTSDYLATSRPTAVNLFWALNRMVEVIKSNPLASVGEVKRKLFVEAERIRNEDVEISRKIGNIGFSLMKEKKKEKKIFLLKKETPMKSGAYGSRNL